MTQYWNTFIKSLAQGHHTLLLLTANDTYADVHHMLLLQHVYALSLRVESMKPFAACFKCMASERCTSPYQGASQVSLQ